MAVCVWLSVKRWNLKWINLNRKQQIDSGEPQAKTHLILNWESWVFLVLGEATNHPTESFPVYSLYSRLQIGSSIIGVSATLWLGAAAAHSMSSWILPLIFLDLDYLQVLGASCGPPLRSNIISKWSCLEWNSKCNNRVFLWVRRGEL